MSVVSEPSATYQAAAETLHQEAIVLDMVSPLFRAVFPRAAEEYLAGGVTAVGVTLVAPNTEDLKPVSADMQGGVVEGLNGIVHVHRMLRQLPDRLLLVQQVGDLREAKRTGRLGLVLHFQNCTHFEAEPGYVELFYRLGVRVAQLTYNVRNLVGDGCMEPTDGGLSRFGVRLIAELNRVGMVVDGSHTGERTTLEAMQVCTAPFVFTHVGCRALHDHPRNVTDTQIRECARTGGVVGIVGAPIFLGDHLQPRIATVVRHIQHVATLAGADHVGIGMDYAKSLSPYVGGDEAQAAWYERILASGNWDAAVLPPPPWRFAPGLETPASLRNLTATLLESGFSDAETRKIMGENFLRVFDAVWRPVPDTGEV